MQINEKEIIKYNSKSTTLKYNQDYPDGHVNEGNSIWQIANTEASVEIDGSFGDKYNLTIPENSSIIKGYIKLKDSWSLSGDTKRTRIKIFKDSEDELILDINPSHKKELIYQRNLLNDPLHFNTETSLTVKISSYIEPVWSIKNSLPAAAEFSSGFGISPNDAVVVGGRDVLGNATSNVYKTTNGGDSWETVSKKYPRDQAILTTSTGSESTGLIWGGRRDGGPLFDDSSSNSFEFDSTHGDIFVNGTTLNLPREYSGGSGDNNEAFCVGGITFQYSYSIGEKYNGTTWSVIDSIYPFSHRYMMSFGNKDNALISGGSDIRDNPSGVVMEWDGVTWNTHSILNVARSAHGACGTYESGINDYKGIIFGGHGLDNELFLIMGTTEIYENGTWRIGSSMLTSRSSFSTAGDSGLSSSDEGALCAGGTNLYKMCEIFETADDTPDNLTNLTSGEIDVFIDYITY